jgi:predicted nucleotidyltransferase
MSMPTTTVKHVARRLGADERTLRRAVEQGLVQAERVSPRRIEIGPDELRYLGDNWLLLRQLRSALRTEPNVRLAVLFGSAARGAQAPASDLDLLVELRDESWERRQRLNTRLEQAVRRPVDLVPLSRARASLIAAALREGRVLVDRDADWRLLKRDESKWVTAARRQERREREDARAALDALLA